MAKKTEKSTTKTPRMLSDEGLAFLKRRESLELELYRDAAGHKTIGYGHKLRPGESFAKITTDEAEELLRLDLEVFEAGVNSLVEVPLEQHQFDALVSFAFNVGLDIDADKKAEGLGDSTLLKKLNAGDFDGAADEFEKWCNVTTHDGRKVPLRGLKNRRALEEALFSTGVYA